MLARVFRPTLLEVLGLSNLQLGAAYSAYGLVAIGAYLFGGPLADRFAPRRLIVVALLATAAGGILYSRSPSANVLIALYAWWGLTTILLFWAAMLRATREWGGESSQGRAFGLLEGGRGLVSALMATLSVALFAALLPVNPSAASTGERSEAFAQVTLLATGTLVLAAVAIFVWLPHKQQAGTLAPRLTLAGLGALLRRPMIWLQAVIIVCAYLAYRVTDLFSQYASDVHAIDAVDSAGIGALTLWLRPIGAVLAGWAADRWSASRLCVIGFALVAAACALLGQGLVPVETPALAVLVIAGACLGIFALRGIYFALTQEARVPLALTGSAVGLVSVVGYTPDVFAGPLFGYLLDRAPGVEGHRDAFLLVSGAALIGGTAALAFARLTGTANRG